MHKEKIDSLNIIIKHQNKKINELNKLIEKYETKDIIDYENENKQLIKLLKDNNIKIKQSKLC